MIDPKYSFKLVSKKTLNSLKNNSAYSSVSDTPKIKQEKVTRVKVDKIKDESVDNGRRLFLKIASVAGLGLFASSLFPKEAKAYVAGSTPTSNVVGSKNAANTRINPATEDTLALIQAKTANLTFDGSNNLLTASSGGASSVTIKDTTDTVVNPATDDSAMLLRRLVKQVDSLAVVDSAQRQKVTLDSITGSLTLSTVTTVGTVTTVSTVTAVTTVTTVTSLTALGGVDGRYLYIDTARNASANGIRSNLVFS
jgi:hypothetical protein